MNKERKKGLVPALRFPDFRAKNAWQREKLSELAKRITIKNRAGDISRVLTNSAMNGVMDQRAYFDKDIAVQGNLSGYYVVEVGDYVYNPRKSNMAPVGPISKNKIDAGVVSPLYTVFRFKNKNTNFYEQYFKSKCWHQYLRQMSNSGARHDRMNISSADFDDMPLPVPSTKEQQKIADCLSSLDELIAAHTKKYEALQFYKKGLMQNLFPAEGETVPALRFPEFEDAGEWELKELGKIANFYKGKGISKADVLINGRQPCIRYGELYTVYGEVIDEVISRTDLPTYNLFLSDAGDVIIPSSGETKIDIATAACVVQKGIALGGDLNVIRSKQNGFFLSYYLNGALKYEIAKVAQGDTVAHLYKSNLESLELALPPKPKEQQKIADCLSSLDDLIGRTGEKIEDLKAHKKGLMQQLFPAMDEVAA